MTSKVYSIFDLKSSVYNAPMFVINVQTVLRGLHQQYQDQDSMIAKYAEDYLLFELGSWDDQIAELRPYEKPLMVCKMSDLLENPLEKTTEEVEMKINHTNIKYKEWAA